MGGKGSGRKPKPTALRILEGNPGKRPLPELEPQPPAVQQAQAPLWLNDSASELYLRLAEELVLLKLLTVVDTEMLAMYCESWCQYLEAVQAIEEEGAVVWVNGVRGEQRRETNPWVAIKKSEFATIVAVAKKFGFSPADRVGLAVLPEDGPVDPITAMAIAHRAARDAAKETQVTGVRS